MNTALKVIDQYRELASLHRDMLAKARDDDWEGVADIARRADELRSALVRVESRGASDAASADGGKAAHIEETLRLIAEIRSLAEPAHAGRAEQLANDTVRLKVKGAYGV